MQELARQTRAWACYDCGKCTATCPISRAGSPLSPRRHVLATVMGHKEDIHTDEVLSSCLSCSLCDFRCPAEVKYTDLVLELREMVFSDKAQPDCPHGGALQSVMRMMAKGETQQNRLDWLTDDLKTEHEKRQGLLLHRLHHVLRRLLPGARAQDSRRDTGDREGTQRPRYRAGGLPGRGLLWSRPAVERRPGELRGSGPSTMSSWSPKAAPSCSSPRAPSALAHGARTTRRFSKRRCRSCTLQSISPNIWGAEAQRERRREGDLPGSRAGWVATSASSTSRGR